MRWRSTPAGPGDLAQGARRHPVLPESARADGALYASREVLRGILPLDGRRTAN